MDSNINSGLYLPDEVNSVIWRIFGSGEDPLNCRATYELIEPIIKFHVSVTSQNQAISEIRSWFDSYGDHEWLKSDKCESVADLILKGTRNERTKKAIWAIGSIDADLATRIIRAHWSPEEIDSFVETALTTLQFVCEKDVVLDATRCTSVVTGEFVKAKIPKSSVVREGRLETFLHLDNHGFELVNQGLYPAIANLIDLIVQLRPQQYELLIENLDHPVIQARAAHHMIVSTQPLDHGKILQWITVDSCNALIALAILHTLNTVNKLDDEIWLAEHKDVAQYKLGTDLRLPREDLDSAASDLLNDLVDRLAALDPLACTRWVGELLSNAPFVLNLRGNREMPHRIQQLENACTKLLSRLTLQSWSNRLISEFRAGLCLTSRATWARHMAGVAWEIRDVAPTRAAEIARAVLEEHERQIAEKLQSNRLYLNWNDWRDREWISGLGVALVLSCEEINLPKFVSKRCQTLPLSVWDVEQNLEVFISADRIAQHWFLVALHAICVLQELGREISSAEVCDLAETLWAHCHFVGQFFEIDTENSIAAEFAARTAVQYGEPSDVWLLNQARDKKVGSRALWALVDQRILKNGRENEPSTQYDKMITTELTRVASNRFGDGGQFNLESLRYWGQLWFLLGAINEAEQNAVAIIKFGLRKHDRVDNILILKLLALVACKQETKLVTSDYIKSLYNQLWPTYNTPSQERVDRQQIENMFEQSEFLIL